MAIIETIAATGKVASAVGTLGRHSPYLIRKARQAAFWLRKGALQIPVFGSGGVGKSTSARVLAGAKADDVYGSYEESLYSERIPLLTDLPGHLLVVPGQLRRVDQHWPHAFAMLAKGNSVGLINVVAYGYHSLELETYKSSDVYKEGMELSDFLPAYLSSRRDIEIQLIERLIDGLSATTSRVWMATLINKKDLWVNNEEEVLQYYRSGPYQAQVQRVSGRLGSGFFQHEVIPTCFAISNLRSASGEVLASSTAGFDLEARDRTLSDMSRRLKELMAA